jgi:hypothetical protein
MKKMLLFALVTMAFLLTGCKHRIGQPTKAVLQTFETMFPGAIHVQWAEQFAVYMAYFYHDGHEKQAQFDSAGTWLRTRTETSIYEVPPQVLKTAREFSDWKIDDVFLFEQSNGAAAYYMVEYNHGTPFSTKHLHILTDGTILAAI